MVYIRLTPEKWIVSGLQQMVPKSQIITINKTHYIPYKCLKPLTTFFQSLPTLITQQDILTNLQMCQLLRQSELTPQQKQHKLELKMKHQMRVLQIGAIGGRGGDGGIRDGVDVDVGKYYFQETKQEGVKDLSKSLSFGMTFLFSFFMAGLTGYYVGTYFLSLNLAHSLILSALFIMATIIIETSLFIIKQNRDDRIKARKTKEKYQEQFMKPSYHQYKKRMQQMGGSRRDKGERGKASVEKSGGDMEKSIYRKMGNNQKQERPKVD